MNATLRHGCLSLLVTAVVIVHTIPAGGTQYAGEPYHLGVGGRALGRGGAFTASDGDASSVFWNAAVLTQLARPEVLIQHAETFGALLNHEFVAFAVPPQHDGGWAWGGYLTYLGGSGIGLTVLDSATGRPRIDKNAGHADWSLAVGIARRGGSWWSWGVTAKGVVRKLPGSAQIAANSAWGLGLDAAWWGRYRGGRFGIKIADLTSTFLSYASGREETINPHVNWGGEFDLPGMADGLTTIVAAEAETYFESRQSGAQYWSGSISVDLHVGFEAVYRDMLFGRIGSDKGVLALGAGFASGHWGIDAALTDHEFLDDSYRVSLRYLFQ